jgi:hypothetical protein
MCKFFSFVTDGKTNRFFFNDEKRSELIQSNPEDYNFDSHSSICKLFNLKEDNSNKYEFNPLTGEFTVDQINNKSDDHALAEKWVRALNFKTVVKELVLKPIIHPFQIDPPEINETHIELLKQWNSVWDSVWDSVGDSVWDSVRDSVWDSVRDSVGDSVGDSVRDSVRDSVGDSVWDSVWAYNSSFFILNGWKYTDAIGGINPFQPCIDLWEQGIVPSFDGKTWRLHTKNGIAWEGKL